MSLDVLLPFYGDPAFMRAAVHSVLAQTSPSWRLVVTDDCYPDDSIGPWFDALDDPRVHYSRNETNLGANLNYTHALGKAEAAWVVVMGADDLMLPTYVERMLAVTAQHDDADVVQPGVEVIGADDLPVTPRVDRIKTRTRPRVQEPTVIDREEALISLMRGNWTYFPSLCWRRETIRAIGFRPGFHVVQDLAMLVDVLAGGGGLLLDPEVTFRYRRHGGSDSSVKTISGDRFAEERAFYAQAATELAAAGLPRAARAARLHLTSRLHALSLLPTALGARDVTAARRLVRHGLTPVRRSAARS